MKGLAPADGRQEDRNRSSVSLLPGERIDEAGFGGIRVIQRRGFGYGVDSVLLSSFAAGETGGAGIQASSDRVIRIADLGTGCGIIAMILARKIPKSRLTGIDMSPNAASRAERGVCLSGLAGRVDILCSDILDIPGSHDYDAVVTNPPYFRRPGQASWPGHEAARTDERYISRHETTADLADFIRISASMLRRGGSLFMVHRPDRLTDILTEMRSADIEPRELQLAAPARGRAPNIVLVHGKAGAGAELRLLPEITVRDPDGSYTDEINRYYGR